MRANSIKQLLALFLGLALCGEVRAAFTLSWNHDMLSIRGKDLPGGELKVWYLEAYCRPNCQTQDWVAHTVIGHSTELISASRDGSRLKLRCLLKDGVQVEHDIRAMKDGVRFELQARNPTRKTSEAHWAQPCIRVGEFTGLGDPLNPRTYAYLRKSFVFRNGHPILMPTADWATEARYTPGQVWAAPGVPRSDVNPRPLSSWTPSNGLIGCFSSDNEWIMATAWDPYQELFQGVATCLHSDFRIAGLQPGETKKIKGRIYLIKGGVNELLKAYRRDFGVTSTSSR